MKSKPVSLVEYKRNGVTECEHFGYILRLNQQKIEEEIGQSSNQKFYLRSCMKPLQSSILIDFDLVKYFNLSLQEVAICTSSHSGNENHTTLVKNILQKIGLSENELKCPAEAPLSQQENIRLLQNGKKPSKIHSNCSGKHAMMLAACIKNNWDIRNYDDFDHPLQKYILSKVADFAQITIKEIPLSNDGCGLPVCALSLQETGMGLLNLFFDKKYELIKKAFINFPYLIGGENRPDSEIMNVAEKGLIAKSGAGGLIIVINPTLKEIVIVKILDGSVNARTIVTVEYLKKCGWLDANKISHSPLANLCSKDIRTVAGIKVGEIDVHF